MSQAFQGDSSTSPIALPLKRRRGRPRKDPSLKRVGQPQVPPRFELVQEIQPQQANRNDAMIGQAVTGVVEAAFDAGYLLRVRIGDSNTNYRGVVFKPDHYVPVTAANDVAPHVQMIRRNELHPPAENQLLVYGQRAERNGSLNLGSRSSKNKQVGESPHPGMTPFSSMGNLLANHNAEFRNGHGSPMKSKSASPVPVDTPLALSRSISADSSLPPPVPVSVSPATSPEPMPSPVAAKNHHHEIAAGAAIGTTAAVAAAVAMDSPTTTAEATASSSGGNDYADVNSDEEAEDQMHMSDEEDVLREVEEKNFALARQLDEAHSVIERARMSISMSGDDDDEEGNDDGLSEEQISLFKKLTSQAEERMSMVDRLHPQDDSDSDSDSDSGEEEEEEDEGVWI